MQKFKHIAVPFKKKKTFHRFSSPSTLVPTTSSSAFPLFLPTDLTLLCGFCTLDAVLALETGFAFVDAFNDAADAFGFSAPEDALGFNDLGFETADVDSVVASLAGVFEEVFGVLGVDVALPTTVFLRVRDFGLGFSLSVCCSSLSLLHASLRLRFEDLRRSPWLDAWSIYAHIQKIRSSEMEEVTYEVSESHPSRW